ncbi:glycosyltransferase [Alloalcanivorax xenomutans]|uniref:glycosyltransferase family 4 protein n=1 Tax=Alloalcanivorax xenomutans TaxID=1094342 RepID=UPI003A81145E
MMMDVLVVTPVWSGAAPIFFEGSSGESGMPAFVQPLKAAIESSLRIRIVLLCSDEYYRKQLNLAAWLDGVEITKIKYDSRSRLKGLLSLIQCYRYISKEIKCNRYSLMYAHGAASFFATVAARMANLKVGQRLYGSFLWSALKNKGRTLAFIKYPLDYLSFLMKKEFMIVTDDGTGADLFVKSTFKNRPPYDFYYMQNGVEALQCDLNEVNDLAKGKYIFYPARITHWKRQDLAIELLKNFDSDVDLIFSGKEVDPSYSKILRRKATEYGLNSRVHFLGELTRVEVAYFMKNSLAVCAFYDVSAKGNVALEAIAYGCVLISLYGRGLDTLIEDGVSGILGGSVQECSDKAVRILCDEKEYELMKKAALMSASKKIESWPQRVKVELDLIREHGGDK